MKMLLGKLFTAPLQDHDAGGEIGQFEIDVDVERKMFLQSGDKPGLVKRQIALHLGSSIHTTGVPKEYWRFVMDEKVSKHTGLPESLNFGAVP